MNTMVKIEKNELSDDEYLVLLARTYHQLLEIDTVGRNHFSEPEEDNPLGTVLDQILEAAEGIETTSWQGLMCKMFIASDVASAGNWNSELNSSRVSTRVETRALLAARKLILNQQ